MRPLEPQECPRTPVSTAPVPPSQRHTVRNLTGAADQRLLRRSLATPRTRWLVERFQAAWLRPAERVFRASRHQSLKRLAQENNPAENREIRRLLPVKSGFHVPGWIRQHLRDDSPLWSALKFGRSEEHTSELQSRGHLVC